MRYTQEIILDLNPNSAPPIVYAKQGDVDSRGLTIHITQNQEDYDLSANGVSSATLRIHKPDGTTAYISDLPVPGSGNVVHVVFTEQCLIVSGRAYADLLLSNQNELLSSISFILIIQPAPDGMRGVPSTSEYASFSQMLAKVDEVTDAAKAWVVGPNPPSQYDTASSSNNAKYWADSIGDKYQEIAAMTIGIDQAQNIIPGAAPEIAKATDSFTFTLTPPAVNIHASASASTGENLGVTASIGNYSGTLEEGQIENLQKQLNLNFTFPSAWSSNVTVTTNLNTTTPGLAADASTVGSALTSAANAYQTAIMSNGAVKIENGGTGASTPSSARSALGAQGIIQIDEVQLPSSGWDGTSGNYTKSVSINIPTGITLSAAPHFIASPNDMTSWTAAADATLGPPTATYTNGQNSWSLTFPCEDIPPAKINITVYWW